MTSAAPDSVSEQWQSQRCGEQPDRVLDHTNDQNEEKQTETHVTDVPAVTGASLVEEEPVAEVNSTGPDKEAKKSAQVVAKESEERKDDEPLSKR
jgi:hypothetical protein